MLDWLTGHRWLDWLYDDELPELEAIEKRVERLVIVVTTVVQLPSAPDDLARFSRQQAGYAAQKTRLANAVRTDDLQQLAAIQGERRAA